MRDYQKGRVYSTAWATAHTDLHGVQFKNHAEAAAYIEGFGKSQWFKSRFPVTRVKVQKGRGHRWAHGWKEGTCGYVKLPDHVWCQNEYIALHEMAHTSGHYDHGPIYVGILLALIDKKMGREMMNAWMDEFRAHNVDFKMPKWWRR